jgi:hypothetical protein
MAGNDSELQVVITSDVSGLQDGADQASESADTIAEHLGALKSQAESSGDGIEEAAKSAGVLSDAFSNLGTVIAGVFGGLELEGFKDEFESFFESATLGTFEWGESLTNLGISTSLTSEQLQVLQYAADVTGVNFDKLQQVVNRLSLAMLQFQQGSKSVTNAAQVLGVDPSTFIDAYDALGKIGDRVREIGTLTLEQRGALETFLGGRGGAQILPAIERLQEFQDEAKATGVILSDDMVKSSDEAAESINRLSAAWGALEHQIGAALAPAATVAVQGIGERVFGLQPDEGGGVAGNSGNTGEMQAETLQPAINAQNQLQNAVTSTSSAIDLQTAAIKELAAIAPQTMDQIREYAEADDAAWQQMNQDLAEGATTVLSHVREQWESLQSAVAANREELKNYSSEISSVLEPVAQAFQESFTGVIQGTQTVTQAFTKMADSIGLELLKSGLHDLLVGGGKNTIGGSIFGITGEGGGIAGQLAEAFQGSAISTALKTSLTTAWTGLTAPIENVLGQAFNGIKGLLSSLFGTALQGAASSGVSAGASAAVGAASGAATDTAETALSSALGLFDTVGAPPLTAALIAAIPAMEQLAVAMTLETFSSGGGLLGFASGGIVPGGLGLGIPALVHGGESVLPADLTGFLLDAAGRGGSNGIGGSSGTNINIYYSVNAMDGASVARVLKSHGDVIANAVAQKERDARFTGQGVNRGAFRR